MSNSVRAWLLLVGTLCLGIALGVLGSGAMQDRRMARVNDIRRPGGFVAHVQRVIAPTSDEQWARIRPLVEAADHANGERRRSHDAAMRTALDTLKAQLDPLLDEAQRERLARFAPNRRGQPPFGGRGARGGRRGGPDGSPPREGRP